MNKLFLPTFSRTMLGWYVILLVLCALFLVPTLGLLEGIRYDVPFTYDGDGLEYNLLTKGMIENGWWLENPLTGAPGTLQMYDYAVGSNLDFFVMKILSLFSGNYAVVMNSYFILGFFLTALFSMVVLSYLRIIPPIAIFGSLLFTFQYYHFFRLGHFNLTAYYMIPLMILVLIWVCQGEMFFFRSADTNKGFNLNISRKGWFTLFVLVITSTHSYYGFFGLLLLAVAVLWAFSREYNRIVLLNGLSALFLTILFSILNKVPSLIYGFINGPSFVMSYRYPFEAEIWGLKLIQLLLPTPGHRIPFLADIASQYTQYRPLVNENVSATLGIIGSIGFIILLSWIFIRNFKPIFEDLQSRSMILDNLSFLTVSAILIGTIGGVSAIIAMVFPAIHSYNRISLYIVFFAIIAVSYLLQLLYERYQSKPIFYPVFLLLLLVLLTGGIFDQVPQSASLHAGSAREQNFIADDIFFKEIEEKMPEGSSIFILPDIGGFPNSNPPLRINGSDSLKPYLHTKQLKWSYPTMKGRFWDNWQAAVAMSPPEDILGHLFATGFSGLLIDGYGYPDGGDSTFAIFSNLSGVTPLRGVDGRYGFYDLTGYMDNRKSTLSPGQYEKDQQVYLMQMKSKPELNSPVFATELRQRLADLESGKSS
ncbi:MAG TPA: hypothetical protein VN372_00260 [Methanospirillum sp.]|nr:hypothetical protein [Methanospirillum sp.]